MQTRSVAAASGALVALGFSFLALRSSGALPAADEARPAAAVLTASPSTQAHASTTISVPATRPSPARGPAASPEAQAEAAVRLTGRAQRTAVLHDTLALWSTTDAGAALVWLEQHPEQDQPALLEAIGEGLAADPAGTTFALAYLAQDHERGARLAGSLVRTLAAARDSHAAARLARATPEGWAHEWATVAFATLAYEDAATALAALTEIDDPALRRTTAAALIAGWAERDPAELAEHATVFTAPAEQAAALAVALPQWRQIAPAAAARFVAALGPAL